MALTRPTAAQINTVITTITDPLTVLNQGATAANIDIGFILNRGSASNVALVWQESSGQFIAATTSSTGTTNGNITVSSYANLRVGALTVSSTQASTSKTIGALTVAGGVGIAGDLNVGTSLTVDNGAYGNVVTTQFGSLFATAYGPNNYSIIQAWSSTTGGALGMNAFGNVIYSAGAINFKTGTTIKDKDFPTGGVTLVSITAAGDLWANATTASTSTTTGALVVAGGIGASGNINAGNLTATNLTGTLLTASQPNITTLGGVTSIGASGTTTLTGILQTAAQTNVTSLGTLSGLTVTNIITGNISGNAATATTLRTSRNINGVGFNGSADITVTANAATLSGVTLNSTVLASSLTSVGTIATGTWQGGVINSTYGGTGVNNGGRTLTINTNNGTISFTSAVTLTVAAAASVSGTNTGDQTTVSGNAGTATTLQTSRNINGVGFNGSADITVTANAATLSGVTLNSTVLASSLTSVGTLTSLLSTGAIVGGELFASTRAGDEGGQLNLANAVTNTTLVGNIVIDVWQNRLRIFEGGGTNRGGFFDLSASGTGASTNYGAGGGGGGTPGGTNTQIQFNDSSTFGGSAAFTFNKTSNVVAITGNLTAGNVNSDNHNYANGVSIITTLSTAITTANTNMKGYVDNSLSSLSSSKISANSSNVTVTASFVNVAINSTNVASVSGIGLSITGNITAGNITAGGVRQTISTSAPSGSMIGDQWYDTATDILFQYIYDGTNTYWVDISGQPLNVNIGTVQGTSLSISGVGTVSGAFTTNSTITVNSGNNATAIINGGTNGAGNIGSSGQAFNTVFAKASSAQYADLAEKYTTDFDYASGTVLIFGGTKEVTISTVSHDTRVAGVVTTNPGFIMNERLTNSVTLALTGRVPCQVVGPINKGDRLVASQHPGVAQRLMSSLYEPGCIIGKSLDTIDTNEIKLIEIAIGRF